MSTTAPAALADLFERELQFAPRIANPRPRAVALMFPGQGAQQTRMAADLYENDRTFAHELDGVFDQMGREGAAIRRDWRSDNPTVDIDDVRRAQPLLFAVGYALGRLALTWGVRPGALLGHSAGELVAATLAGVFSLPQAALLVTERVWQVARCAPGGMLAVAGTEDEMRGYLDGDVGIAAVNASRQVMLAGSTEPLRAVADRLRADGFTVRAVGSTSPFHSPAMVPAVTALVESLQGMRLNAPRYPVYSAYTGELLTADEARSVHFWARQLTDTVYFARTLDRMLARQDMILVEAGPGQSLTSFARRHPAVRAGRSAVVAMLPARVGGPGSDRQAALAAAGAIWAEGHDLRPLAIRRLQSFNGV
jgi:[acyl-carrier-protein] S-malonyltransferase